MTLKEDRILLCRFAAAHALGRLQLPGSLFQRILPCSYRAAWKHKEAVELDHERIEDPKVEKQVNSS